MAFVPQIGIRPLPTALVRPAPRLVDFPQAATGETLLSSKMDGASIALYVLSIVGLILFIVVLVFAIISWITVEQKKPKDAQMAATKAVTQTIVKPFE